MARVIHAGVGPSSTGNRPRVVVAPMVWTDWALVRAVGWTCVEADDTASLLEVVR